MTHSLAVNVTRNYGHADRDAFNGPRYRIGSEGVRVEGTLAVIENKWSRISYH